MNDLISRQAAIDEIRKCRFVVDAIEKIRVLPPTADVVEVVRCKDCKYDHKCSHNIIRPSKGGGVIYCSLEYCSEGERAEE